MWIKNIDLDDFGCFNRARLQNIDDGLTVVAGPQRAGKSTFMQAVRHLGYGIPRDGSVPPAADQYDITADVVFDGDEYRLSLEGYSNPHVTPLDGSPDRTVGELFGDLPATQYQQLYTISLDELRRNPDTLDGGVDLSSVLFTAAYGDTDVPDIRDKLATRAKSIGGVNGSNSYDLSDPVETIESGVEARDEALEQVNKYERKSAQKREVDDRIDEIQSELDDLSREQTRVEAVIENYDTYRELQEIVTKIGETDGDLDDVESFPTGQLERARALEGEYDDTRGTLEDAQQAFESVVNAENPTVYREQLLAHSDAVQTYETELSRWREQVKSLRERSADLDQHRDELEQQVSNLHPDWKGLDDVRDQAVDTFATGEVRSTTKQVEELQSDIDDLDDEISRLETRHDELESRIEAASESTENVSNRMVIRSDELPEIRCSCVIITEIRLDGYTII